MPKVCPSWRDSVAKLSRIAHEGEKSALICARMASKPPKSLDGVPFDRRSYPARGLLAVQKTMTVSAIRTEARNGEAGLHYVQPTAAIRRAAGSGLGPSGDFLGMFEQRLRPTEETVASVPYVVKRGDTLWGLCRERLRQDGLEPSPQEVLRAVERVARANQLDDPDLIRIGQQLDLSSAVPALLPLSPLSQEKTTGPRNAASINFALDGVGGTARPVRESVPVFVQPAAGREQSEGLTTHELPLARSPWSRLVRTRPVRLTSEFGMRNDPFTGEPQHHDGIDLAAPRGTEIYPWNEGRVVFSGWEGAYGRMVALRHPDGTETRYGHVQQNLVRVGDWVSRDRPIAFVGSTGRSTASHLHFEIRVNGRPVNPIPLLAPQTLQLAQVPNAS